MARIENKAVMEKHKTMSEETAKMVSIELNYKEHSLCLRIKLYAATCLSIVFFAIQQLPVYGIFLLEHFVIG